MSLSKRSGKINIKIVLAILMSFFASLLIGRFFNFSSPEEFRSSINRLASRFPFTPSDKLKTGSFKIAKPPIDYTPTVIQVNKGVNITKDINGKTQLVEIGKEAEYEEKKLNLNNNQEITFYFIKGQNPGF